MAIADTDPDTTPGHPEPRPDKTRRRRIGRGMRGRHARRDDRGFNLIGILIGVAATAILGAIAWQTLPGVLDRTRTTTLNANINTAAQLLQRLYQDDPDRMTTDVGRTISLNTIHGKPADAVLRWLESEADALRFSSDWAVVEDEAAPDLVRIQFLLDENRKALLAGLVAADRAAVSSTQATALAPVAEPDPITSTAPRAPTVPWLTQNGYAVRIRISDGQENWACALIVPQASFEGYVGTNGDANTRVDPGSSGLVQTGTGMLTTEDAETAVKGIWFDTGDEVDATNGLNDCSPVDDPTTSTDADQARLPATNTGIWTLSQGTGLDLTLTRERP